MDILALRAYASSQARRLWLPLTMLVLALTAVLCRPLLPVDETRYVTVAWEMYLRQGWFEPLTLNFQPYHHKPPLLFWMINVSWAVFGISRWAATVPVVLSALASVCLTAVLGRMLFPQALKDTDRTAMVMVATVPYLAYSTVILFDLTLTVFVLLALIGIVRFARERSWRHVALIGISLGLGVLAKGPVALLYVAFPALCAPLWVSDFRQAGRWYLGILAALGLAAVIVLTWLIPVLTGADGNFAYWLLWEQTAGRVTGNLEAHIWPFYFYLPLLPLMVTPWLFLANFWKGAAILRREIRQSEGGRFLLAWIVPTFLCFCVISGKQPHYLVPLLPGVMIFTALCLKEVSTRQMGQGVAIMIALVIAGQIIAAFTFLKRYDVAPITEYVQSRQDRDWAFVPYSHGMFGFLARLEKPVADIKREDLPSWFAENPEGYAIIVYKDPKDVAAYQAVLDRRYRGSRMGVFSAPVAIEETNARLPAE